MFSISCCALAQTSSVPARIDAAMYQGVVEENLDLRKEQARLEGEAGTLRRKNATLLLDIQNLERKRDQLTALVAQLKTPDELAAQMARLNAEKVVLVREIERLRESLAASAMPVTNSLPAAVMPAPASDLFRKLERENADLRQDMARTRATSMNESVAKEVAQKSEASLKEEVSRLEAQYKGAATELESLRRREVALKKALELQAKKAFDAENAMKKALEMQSQKDAEANVARQKALEAEADLKQAKEKLEAQADAIRKRPVLSDVLTAARNSLLAGRVKDAEKLYLHAYKSDPGNAAISYNLGVLYGDYLKDYKQAAKYYRNYLALTPAAPDADQVRTWLIDVTAKSKW
jgi:chromosome segregation ATPase